MEQLRFCEVPPHCLIVAEQPLPMSGLNVALLDEGIRNDSTLLPALQKLLQLAYSEDTDEQLEVSMIFRVFSLDPYFAA